jgi:hypothetical protein
MFHLIIRGQKVILMNPELFLWIAVNRSGKQSNACWEVLVENSRKIPLGRFCRESKFPSPKLFCLYTLKMVKLVIFMPFSLGWWITIFSFLPSVMPEKTSWVSLKSSGNFISLSMVQIQKLLGGTLAANPFRALGEGRALVSSQMRREPSPAWESGWAL